MSSRTKLDLAFVALGLILICIGAGLCSCGEQQLAEEINKPKSPASCVVNFRNNDLNHLYDHCNYWYSAPYFELGDVTPRKFYWCQSWYTPEPP